MPAPITVEQYEGFQGYPGLRDELILGRIVMSPQPKPFRQQICGNIEDLLRLALQGQPYVVKPNTNIKFELAHSMPAPDLFVVTRAHWNDACRTNSYLSEVPVMVVEVLSPANRKKKVEEKLGLYLTQGVSEVWLVSPKRRLVEVCTAHGRISEHEAISLPLPLRGSVSIPEFFVIPD